MRANDEATIEHIEALEADNDALRVEIELLKEELNAYKVYVAQMVSDRAFLVA
jgi:hypothetical protein